MAPPTPTPASTPTPNRSNRTMLETFHDETAPLNALKPGMQREIHAAEAQIRANRVLLAKIASAIERHKAAPSRQPRPKELETEDALLVDGTDTTMPETDFEAAMNSRNTPDDDAGLNALAFRSKEDQTLRDNANAETVQQNATRTFSLRPPQDSKDHASKKGA